MGLECLLTDNRSQATPTLPSACYVNKRCLGYYLLTPIYHLLAHYSKHPSLPGKTSMVVVVVVVVPVVGRVVGDLEGAVVCIINFQTRDQWSVHICRD